ncbi:MAG: hypothetical protein JW804_06055 [Sedimentisphaerales bacterium]|nr:hypothetical protein [Sedimentisphaerales bacterium]
MVAEVANIVFTKNRPLQLEGYLRSLYTQFPRELIKTYIIFKQELFTEQYTDVFNQYPEAIVIRESDFHSDILGVIEQVQSKYILFGVDDVVFFDKVDFALIDKTFEKVKDDIFGFTLRFNPVSLENSNDRIDTLQIDGQNVYFLDWTKGKTPHTKYPFELCCTFYRTSLVKEFLHNTMSDNKFAQKFFSPESSLVKILPWKMRRKVLKRFGFFFSPNTLESWPCRWCQRNFGKLPPKMFFQELCASAIQVNMVNTSTKNTFDGNDELTVEVLNEKFRQGYRLDTDYVSANKPSGPGCGRDYFKLIKT